MDRNPPESVFFRENRHSVFSADPDAPGAVESNIGYVVAGQPESIVRKEILVIVVSVESVETTFRAYPHPSQSVQAEGCHGRVGQPVRHNDRTATFREGLDSGATRKKEDGEKRYGQEAFHINVENLQLLVTRPENYRVCLERLA